MTTQDNLDRIILANEAVIAYQASRGEVCDLESTLCDLIADLLHAANQENLDTDRILRIARTNFEAEATEALEQDQV